MTNMTFAERCTLSEQCLPDAPYRAMLTKLHGEMLQEIERLNAEVMEQCRINGMSAEREDALRAELTRLKASIALDKMAENARELGLDYEPAVQEPYKGLSEHLSQASGGMVRIDPVTGNVGIGTPEAQPAVQEPVAEVKAKMTGGNVGIATVIHEVNSLHREPLQPGDKLYAGYRWIGWDIEQVWSERIFGVDMRFENVQDAIKFRAKLDEVTTPPAAQPAVQEGRDWSLLAATQASLREHMAEIKRLKAAQPAPVQLTGEQIEHLWETRVSQPCPSYPLEKSDWVQFARAIEAAHGITTPPAAQPAPVKTYSGGKPWPVAPAPDPAPIIQQLVTALEGSGTRMRSDQWYIEIEAVAAGKFYLNSKGANHD